MRAIGSFTAAALGLVVLTSTSQLWADSMDPAFERLVLNDNCRGSVDGAGKYYDPVRGFDRCLTNDLAFAKLVSQLGFALAPVASSPARTAGFGGYKIVIEGSFTTIDSDSHHWQEGTQGAPNKSTGESSTRNPSPNDVLQVYTLKLAKGFPFGVELGASFGYLVNTNIVSGGGDIRLALFEGFREYVPGYLPDVGVAGGVRTITGSPQLKLTIASFAAQLSKPIPIAGTVVLQPHVGYQWIRIFGDSGLIDLTPNTDAVSHCGYQGDNSPVTTGASAPYDGQPVCTGTSADFNNNVVFDNVRLTRHRINFGAQFRFQMVQLGVHVITDLMSPSEANKDLVDVADPDDPRGATKLKEQVNPFDDDPRTDGDDTVNKQWTVAVELGAAF